MKNLASFFEAKLATLTIRYQSGLFPPDWKMLLKGRCPVCMCCLHLTEKGLYICKGKKHRKTFVIKKDMFDQVVHSLTTRNK